MEVSKYLVFDIVCDYLKGKNSCINFRAVCSEFKILSADLFRRYYSIHLLNNILVNIIGIDELTSEDIKDLGYNVILKMIIVGCDHQYINSQVKYKDPLHPINNVRRNRIKFLCNIRKRNSLIFSMALHHAENPRYSERNTERDIP